MDGICFVVAAGPAEALSFKPTQEDFVIAADAGYKLLQRFSIDPNLVVGDFDSLGEVPTHLNVVVHASEKDQTDTLLAVDEGLSRGYTRFIIFGGMGGRLDHTLANIQTLAYIAQRGGRGFLIDDDTAVTVIKNDTITFSEKHHGIISVFNFGENARGVTETGLKYSLSNAELSASYPIGVSNEFVGTQSQITVTDGVLTILWPESQDSLLLKLREEFRNA